MKPRARDHVVALAAWALTVVVGACGADDDRSDAGSIAEPDASSGAAEDATDDGEPMGCEAPLGAGACAELTVCDVFDCGGKAAPYNHFGCARTPCTTDEGCGAEERCFAVALHTGCRAEAGPCADDSGTCTCEGADSCEGVAEAHCLPIGFYPAAEDCVVDSLDCDALELRRTGLDTALAVHEAAGHTQLTSELSTCRQRVATAVAACPDPAAP